MGCQMPELSEQISDAYESQGEKIEEYKKKTAYHGSCICQDNRKWPKVAQQRFRLDIENFFFPEKLFRYWNKLPKEVVQ